ncbi:MAG: hypothetical protein V4547_13615 [Bacteroidota bacterium]
MAKTKKDFDPPKIPLRDSVIKKGKTKANKTFLCKRSGCNFTTNEYNELNDHIVDLHYCKKCNCECKSRFTHHCRKPKDESEIPDVDIADTLFQIKHRSNKGAVQTLQHKYTTNIIVLKNAVQVIYSDLVSLLQKYIKEHQGIRCKLAFEIDCTELKTEERKIKNFHSPFSRLIHSSHIDEILVFSINYIENVIKLLTENGSGIRIEGILSVEVDIGIYKPIRPRGYIKLPHGLKGRQGLLNIKTKDDCFKLSIIAALFEKQLRFPKYSDIAPEMLTNVQKKYIKRQMEKPETFKLLENTVKNDKLLDFSGFETEIDVNDLYVFEKNNGVSVNIYEFDENISDVYPSRITNNFFGMERHVNLLLLSQKQNAHIVLIREPSRFFGRHGLNTSSICPWCSQGFSSYDHLEKCKIMNDVGLTLPSPQNNTTKFKDFHKCLPPAYRMYSDFLYINSKNGMTVGGFGLVALGPQGEIVDSEFYIGTDAMEKFMPYVLSLSSKFIHFIQNTTIPIPEMTDPEKTIFEIARCCEVCGKYFTTENPKTRHHSHHIIGYPITPVCQQCNLQIKPKNILSMFSPTHSKMGSHMILQNIKAKDATSVFIVPKSSENFVSIFFGNKLKLVDTRKFLDFSLQEIISMYSGGGQLEKLKIFKDNMDIEVLKQPWYFPHTWFTSMELLSSTQFPKQEQFYDILVDKDIGPGEYKSFTDLYNKLGCKTFQDYCLFYLKSRVYQTAATMEEFGEWCFKSYGLSPLHDITLASYAYSLSLYYSKCNIELPTEENIAKTIMENIRGGVSHLSKRVVTAKSERLGNENVSDDERTEILIADANSLYQYCLAKPMPIRNYRRLSPEEINCLDVETLSGKSGKGWILTVSLLYSDAAKKQTADFPLCPTKHYLKNSDSTYDFEKSAKLNDPGTSNLLLTQFDKENVAIYYQLLQFYMRQGMVITKIHDVIEFEESPYLAKFISKNNNIRKCATNKFHEQISKLIGNMIFGKFLSVHNNLSVKCATTKTKALTFLSKHDFENFKIVSPDVSLFFAKKNSTVLDKNILVSFVVLDLAKLVMYQLIYDVLKPKFGRNITIVASETDNLVCEIKDPNKTFIQDLRDLSNHFDFSNLPSDHPLFDKSKAKQPGLLKIEYPYPLQFVGIKSKLYSVLSKCESCRLSNTDMGLSCNKCKSVPKGGPRRRHTPHHVYLQTALGQIGNNQEEYLCIKSVNQNVTIDTLKKTTFNVTENHRYWIDYNTSVPHGHLPLKAINTGDVM